MKYNVENLSERIKKKKNRKKIISNTFFVILVLFLIFNIIIVVQTTFNSKKVPNIFGYKAFSITTGSMEPVIQINDLIIVKEYEPDEIKQGDIISYQKDETIITHRVERKIEENSNVYYITKGDDNYILDEQKVEHVDVEGRYILRIPKLGKIVLIFKNKDIVILVIIILIILNYLKNKRNKEKIIRQEQRRKYEMKMRNSDIESSIKNKNL